MDSNEMKESKGVQYVLFIYKQIAKVSYVQKGWGERQTISLLTDPFGLLSAPEYFIYYYLLPVLAFAELSLSPLTKGKRYWFSIVEELSAFYMLWIICMPLGFNSMHATQKRADNPPHLTSASGPSSFKSSTAPFLMHQLLHKLHLPSRHKQLLSGSSVLLTHPLPFLLLWDPHKLTAFGADLCHHV